MLIYLGDVHLDRKEAIDLLKDLIVHDLVEPSWVSIEVRTPNHYQIQIKNNYNRNRIEQFIRDNNLIVEEDKEKRYLLINNP